MAEPSRYLTYEDKLLVLAEWQDAQRERMRPSGDPGGNGYVDPEMVPWCDEINELDGVVTLQSCSGHVIPCADDPSENYIEPGTLWLWLSQTMAAVAYESLNGLADEPAIDEVRLLFGRGRNREILEITWEPARFDSALPVILEFLRDAHDAAWPSPWFCGKACD